MSETMERPKMDREEMLDLLSTTPFEMIWPDDNWRDIGFTEREIWVNSEGYGYIACDECTGYFEGAGIDAKKWKEIRAKLMEDELKAEDIEETSLAEMIDQFYWTDLQEAIDDGVLSGIFDLPDDAPAGIYCLQTDNGPEFYRTQAEMDRAYERDGCDYAWEELDDEMLAVWIKRLGLN